MAALPSSPGAVAASGGPAARRPSPPRGATRGPTVRFPVAFPLAFRRRVPGAQQDARQGNPPTRAPGLHGALRDAEQLGGLGHRQLLHVDEDDRLTLGLGQPREGGREVDPALGRRVLVARRRQVGVAERHGRAGGAAPHPVEAGVDHDPVEPGRDGRVPPVGGRVAERRQQCVLQGVRGVLAVAHGPQRDGPQPVAVAADELGERVRVTRDVRCHRAPGRPARRRPSPSHPRALRLTARRSR